MKLRSLSSELPLRDLSLFFALLAVWVACVLWAPSFLTPFNLTNLATQVAITASLALGMFLVLLPGQIDLSVGSGVGLLGGLSAVLVFHHGVPAPLALLAALAVGLVLWALMGTLIARQRVPAFITTLGGLLVFQGLFQKVIDNTTVPVRRGSTDNALSLLTTHYFPSAAGFAILVAVTAGLGGALFASRSRRQRYGLPVEEREVLFLRIFVAFQSLLLLQVVVDGYQGLPLAVLVLGALTLLVHVLTRHTPFGRYLYAIGGNREAAIVSGVPVERTIVTAFVLLGGIVALVGCMQTAYQGSSTPGVGRQMELDAIAACVIGGTSLSGGKGNVVGVLVGSLLMVTLLNGLGLAGASDEVKLATRGAVLVLAVWLDVRMGRRG